MKRVRPHLLLILVTLAVVGQLVATFVTPAFAQTPGPTVKYDPKSKVGQNIEKHIEAVEESEAGVENLQGTVKNTNSAFMYDLTCQIFNCNKQQVTDQKTGAGLPSNEGPYGQGAISSLGSAIGYMYAHPAADTGSYVAYVLNTAGIEIVQPAYAQGLGFSALTPVLDAWRTFRNIAYFFFVVIFLVIGFMIMFRQKIGSQTVVTAQQAIPHILVSLLFVTFSYAIAGLLIDLMYLVMFFMIGIFGKNQDFVNQNFLGVAKLLISGNFLGVTYDSVSNFIGSALGGDSLADAAGMLGGALAIVIVGVAILIGVFRLFFELLKTYISILISVTMAPLVLMVGAIPGRNAFGTWLKGLVGNLVAFPVVTLVLILYDELTQGAISTPEATGLGLASGGFLPPYLGGVGSADSIRFLIGLGMILIIPDLVTQAKKAFGGGGGIFEQLAQSLGESVKRGWTGGELIPGLGFTKIPGAKQITQTAAPVGATALGALPGAYMGYQAYRQKGLTQAKEAFMRPTRLFGRAAADVVGSPLYKAERKKRGDEKDLAAKLEKYKAKNA